MESFRQYWLRYVTPLSERQVTVADKWNRADPGMPDPHQHYPRGYQPAGTPAEVAAWHEEHGKWIVQQEPNGQGPLTEERVRAIVRDELRQTARREREDWLRNPRNA